MATQDRGPEARDALAEAAAQLPEGQVPRVLEPSPPPDNDPDWYADDPTDPSTAGPGVVVSPTDDGDITWEEVAAARPEVASFARSRWLGPRPGLGSLPDGFAGARAALHQLAYFVVAPARFAAVGKLGLRWTRGGFGTPFLRDGGRAVQVRVEGDVLVRQVDDRADGLHVTTIGAACEFLGHDYRPDWFTGFRDPLEPVGADEALVIDPTAAAALGDWFGFTTAVLEQLRRTPGAEDVGRVQLWPEHFDPAVELGSGDAGTRASYGASPGDDEHDGPYLYVSPWGAVDVDDPTWNDSSFGGASLGHDELLRADDQFAAALGFFQRCHGALHGDG